MTKNIIISESVRNFISSYSDKFIPLETGGIIIGFEDNKNIYITHATQAGPKAVHKNILFIIDEDYTKKELDKIFISTNGSCDYLGEWHSHPINCQISITDKLSIYSLALNPFNNIKDPLLLININNGQKWNKTIYRYKNFMISKIYSEY
jgi:integrative and conjugative element protein (TIGR02256 family)